MPRLLRQLALAINASALVTVVIAGPSLPATGIPTEAAALIARVRDAAKSHDYVALEQAMSSEFVSSFGGDGGPREAIETWRATPLVYLPHLVIALKQGCRFDNRFEDNSRIQCRETEGEGFRAGFIRTPSGWRFEYFVAGD